MQAHHLQWVAGDVREAERILGGIVENPGGSGALRATAALRLADMAEAAGDRRGALGHLDQARGLAGAGDALALEADDRRARILAATPLADVRGPVPGTVPRGETAPVGIAFRRAEQLLVAYHRVVVAPSLENVNEVLRVKRRALAAAVAAYQKIAATGGPAARAAAAFRMGAVYHHLAEAMAFESPSELLPSVARLLARQLRAESANHLRRALTHYRASLEVPATAGTAPWQQFAKREAETLDVVLQSSGRKARP